MTATFESLMDEIAVRLPAGSNAGALRYAAQQRNVQLVEENLDERGWAVTTHHLAILANHDFDAAHLLLGVLGDGGTTILSNLAATQWVSDLCGGVHADQHNLWIAG